MKLLCKLLGCATILLILINGCTTDVRKIDHQDRGQNTEIFAGGISLRIIEKDSTYIKLDTDTILPFFRIKSIISDLMHEYDNIYFYTSDSIETGNEYSSWDGNRYFDFKNEKVISKYQLFRNQETIENTNRKQKKKLNYQPRKRKSLDSPL